jgi:hypothetical protein
VLTGGATVSSKKTHGLLVRLVDQAGRLGEVAQPGLGAHRWDLDDLDVPSGEEVGGVTSDPL